MRVSVDLTMREERAHSQNLPLQPLPLLQHPPARLLIAEIDLLLMRLLAVQNVPEAARGLQSLVSAVKPFLASCVACLDLPSSLSIYQSLARVLFSRRIEDRSTMKSLAYLKSSNIERPKQKHRGYCGWNKYLVLGAPVFELTHQDEIM